MNKSVKILVCALVAGLFLLPPVSVLSNDDVSYETANVNENRDNEKIEKNLANMKGWFTENKGQIENDEVSFVYTALDRTVGFIESGYLLKMTGNGDYISIIRVTFKDSNLVEPVGIEEFSHKSNYFIGNDPAKWRTEVPNYNKIVYENLFDGIDMVFYTTEKGLKYDFVVHPFKNPDEIKCHYHNIEAIEIDAEGKLLIDTGVGTIIDEKPYSYQNIDGQEVEIPSEYQINDNIVSIKIGNYDTSINLIVDPLSYSTFVGDEDAEFGLDIVLDSNNNAYVTGYTESSDFPTTNGCYDDTYNGGSMDVFIFKLSSDGSSLSYSTFVGGENEDKAYGIEIDSSSKVYVTGGTNSSDFPTTQGCYDDSHNDNYDVFVFVLNSNGTSLNYSTFVGGEETDGGLDIVIDSNKNVYVTGMTRSSDFPTTFGCYDSSINGYGDVFVFKMNSQLSSLTYSTFVGGNDQQWGYGITLDQNNNPTVTGKTESTDFPTTNGCYDDSYNGGSSDVFVFQLLGINGASLIYSTYVGGDDLDFALDITIDTGNQAYVTGYTYSDDFPTTLGCYDDTLGGYGDIFVFKLDSIGGSLVYSTFVGGDDDTEIGMAITLDSNNNAHITGSTHSDDFPTTSGCYDDSFNGLSDMIIFKLNSNGTSLDYSTYIGGEHYDGGWGITLDSNDDVYISGYSHSDDFPTTNGCYDGTHNGDYDVIVLKLELDSGTPP